MAQAIVLTAATAAGTSSAITVTTTPMKVSLYSGETDGSYSQVKCPVFESTPGSKTQPFNDETTTKDERTPVYLSDERKSYLIKSPGTYTVVKALSTKAIGVFTESGL